MLLLGRSGKVGIGFGKKQQASFQPKEKQYSKDNSSEAAFIKKRYEKYPGTSGNTHRICWLCSQATQHPSNPTVINGKQQEHQQPGLSL